MWPTVPRWVEEGALEGHPPGSRGGRCSGLPRGTCTGHQYRVPFLTWLCPQTHFPALKELPFRKERNVFCLILFLLHFFLRSLLLPSYLERDTGKFSQESPKVWKAFPWKEKGNE